MIRIVVLALCTTSFAAQAADEPLSMAPASDWAIDYAESSCALRRSFQAGDEQVTLEFRQFGPGDGLQITLLSTTLSGSSATPRVRFEPDEGFHEPPASFKLDEGEARGILFNDSLRPNAEKRRTSPLPDWPEADRETRERAITGLTLRSAFWRTVTLQLGAMRQPMNAMRTCLDELLAQWGLDAATQRTLSRKPRPLDQQSWARRIQASYPEEMVRQRRSGMVNIRLIVGPDGSPTACIPDPEFSTTGFDEHACAQTMRHVRFEPALDAKGTPVASLFTTTITYQITR